MLLPMTYLKNPILLIEIILVLIINISSCTGVQTCCSLKG